jgi:pimeloyl-ACP methyl ester carboxylesterase
MSSFLLALVIFAAIGAGLWAVSFLIEAMRTVPQPPMTLRWAPDIPISCVEVDGNKLRYVASGSGPALVLLHTLRTQLDLFEKVVPELSKHFTVYALDLPGHGYSDIPDAKYDAEFFAHAVEGFLDRLDLRDVTLAGVSIGASISLILAARHNPRVARVVAFNPYDYAKGRGMARSSLLGGFFTYASLLPVIGETVMRLRMRPIVDAVFRGGVVNADSIPPALLREMYLVGNRRGQYRGFLALLRNSASWETATKDYGRIAVPALFVWGSDDWARPTERLTTRVWSPAPER